MPRFDVENTVVVFPCECNKCGTSFYVREDCGNVNATEFTCPDCLCKVAVSSDNLISITVSQ